MNRIQLADPQADKSSSSTSQAVLVPISDASTPHALFGPLHYEPGYSYPLVIWLHGPGDDERQLQRVMPLISMRNYVAVGPRGSSRDESVPRAYCWQQSAGDIAAAEQRVLECLELVHKRFNTAADRVFIGGYECGGTMAMRVGMKHPELFAGVMSIGGPFPTGMSPLANVTHARTLPLFIAHGRASRNYPVSQVCHELRLLHSAGFNVNLRQYPCGDELTTQMLHDLDVWLMEQITGQPAPDSEPPLYRDELN